MLGFSMSNTFLKQFTKKVMKINSMSCYVRFYELPVPINKNEQYEFFWLVTLATFLPGLVAVFVV